MFDPDTIDKIPADSDINDLSETNLKNLQRGLSWMTYPISKVDGVIGPNTRNAFAEFKTDIGESNPSIVSQNSKDISIMSVTNTQDILNQDVSDEERTRDVIAKLCVQLGLGLQTQIAYVWATTKWETNHTFAPVREAYWKSEAWRKNNLHYYPYYGRGYVQLTWRSNYGKYGNILREKFISDPDLALDPKFALFTLVHGFKLGVFTGRKLEDYVNDTKTDFKNARRCINGLDKWDEIKKIAENYLD